VFPVDGDHDAPLVRSAGLNDALLAGVAAVERRLGLATAARLVSETSGDGWG
jgi:hypothetical protein